MKELQPEEHLTERRLERAAKFVSDYWFPPKENLIAELQHRLKEGVFTDQPLALIEEIKKDLSLFTFTITRLAKMLADEQGRPSEISPFQALQMADIDRLNVILSEARLGCTRHCLDNAGTLQISRFQETLLSKTTAAALAPSYGADPAQAAGAAILRQLGLTLVAWNYPSVYQRCIASLAQGESVELALAKELGFSPTTLAVKVLSSHGFRTEDLQHAGLAADDEEEDEELLILDAIGATLADICAVSEAFARANQPDLYPGARDDWRFAARAIEERLGANGIEQIRESYHEQLESYLDSLPEIFKGGLMLNSDLQDAPEGAAASLPNPFVHRCKPQVQCEFAQLYSQLKQACSVELALRILLREISVTAGFSAGCVYTVDPALMLLLPQMQLGTLKLRHPEPVDYSLAISANDLISVAFQTATPVVSYGVAENGDALSALAGVFGHSHRVGVLYLETKHGLSNCRKSLELIQFQAIVWALNDCLHLE